MGSGWDQRQRACAYASYAEREIGDGGGGGWYERVTVRSLVGSLRPAHHLSALRVIINQIGDHGDDYRARYLELLTLYHRAAAVWPRVAATTGSPLNASHWIQPLESGLRLYGAGEGW